jgi:hypothetical protein
MRAAPAVQATLTPDRGWAAFTRGLSALALAGLAAWAAQGLGAPGWAMVLAAVPSALVGWAMGQRFLAAPHGTLRWDGAAWSWHAHGGPAARTGVVAVMIDLGPWMLLRLQPAGAGAIWLPAAQDACGPAWRALRAALHTPEVPE